MALEGVGDRGEVLTCRTKAKERGHRREGTGGALRASLMVRRRSENGGKCGEG